jgi:hypothetical protein
MALTTLTRERTAAQSLTSPTSASDSIIAIRAAIALLTKWEEKELDAAGTKRWVSVGPVAGSHNVDQRITFYHDSASSPVDRSAGTTANNNDLFVGYAPNGGAATFGDPVTDGTLYTGGTAEQNRFSGFMNFGYDADGAGGYSSHRLIVSEEDLWLVSRISGGDWTQPGVWGAIFEPDGLAAESDGRLHGWFTNSQTGAGDYLANDWLTAAVANQKRFLRVDGAPNGEESRVFDPVATTLIRDVRAISDIYALSAQSMADDAGKAALMSHHLRFGSGATSGRIGRLRQAYIWGDDQSMQAITSGGGGTTQGWTLGATESTVNDCILVGA